MPQPDSRSAGWRIRRLLILILLTMIIGGPIIITALRLLPPHGLGYYLYWIHDHLYLPAKGFTYNLFFPLSLLIWGPLAGLIVLWIISFLMPEPLYKRAQIALTRKTIHRPLLHPLLVRSAAWLKRLRFQPQLLLAVTSMERQKAMLRLYSLPLSQTQRNIILPAIRLTILHIRLLTLSPTHSQHLLEAAVHWQEIMIRLRPRVDIKDKPKWLERPFQRLNRQMETILPKLLRYNKKVILEIAQSAAPRFDTQTIALDLLHLWALTHDDAASYALGPGTPTTQKQTLIARHLSTTAAARRRILDRNRTQLEQDTPGFRMEVIKTDPQELPLLGRLALLGALEASRLAGTAGTGLGYIESVEALDFILQMQIKEPAKENQTATLPTALKALERIVTNSPEPQDYRFCAELAENEFNKQKDTWIHSAAEKEKLIVKEDFNIKQSRIRSLYHASGPNTQKHE